jgi:hypothetical protein
VSRPWITLAESPILRAYPSSRREGPDFPLALASAIESSPGWEQAEAARPGHARLPGIADGIARKLDAVEES